MKYYRKREVLTAIGIAEAELELLEREHLIEVKRTLENEPVISADDVEKARFVSFLTRELEVNLPGAEVILHMREDMIAMRRQFGKVLEALVEELRRNLHRQS